MQLNKGSKVWVSSWAPDFMGIYEGVVGGTRMLYNVMMVEVDMVVSEFGTMISLEFPINQVHDNYEEASSAFHLQIDKVVDELDRFLANKQMSREEYNKAIDAIDSARCQVVAKLASERFASFVSKAYANNDN